MRGILPSLSPKYAQRKATVLHGAPRLGSTAAIAAAIAVYTLKPVPQEEMQKSYTNMFVIFV